MIITIAGHYTTKIGELWESGLEDLAAEAVEGVLANSSINPKAVDAIFVASKAAGSFNNQRHLNALVSGLFSHNPSAMRIEGACASGGLALVAAEQFLLSGSAQTVLVLGVEKMTDLDVEETTSVLSTAADTNLEEGSTFPGLYALLAQAHELKYGTSREMLSSVAVKNHRHAMENPLAHYHKEFILEQISNSPLVADPLRLLDCSPISDGASAVILTTKKVKQKTKIIGVGQGQDSLDLAGRSSLIKLKATELAAKKAYDISGQKPTAIELAEVHDCFTIAEILAIEDLGFFSKGEGGKATLEGKTDLGERLVVNKSGGLKAFGHPVGATGVKQLAYLAQQIERGEGRLGLTHNVGGSGATAVVHILSK
ncbi:MAG: Thiolase [Microgenomates bacterium 39_7]|nr:MAG: Thiolase [Microgenomates bacterium 39_7]